MALVAKFAVKCAMCVLTLAFGAAYFSPQEHSKTFVLPRKLNASVPGGHRVF